MSKTTDPPEPENTPLPDPVPTPTPQELIDLQELLKRTQANFENYRKQSEKRIEEITAQAAKQLILKLLPLLDNFELALKNAPQPPDQFTQGIELIYAQFQTLLEEQSVLPLPIEDTKFDPHLHEPLLRQDSELAENTILEVFQKGYTLHGKIIRHAKVKISSGKKSA